MKAPEQPLITDEVSEAHCLVCKKPAGTDALLRQRGRLMVIQNRKVWVCKDDLAGFERGRRVGQVELNSKVVQCLSTLEDQTTGWKLKEKILEFVPAARRSVMIKSQLNNIEVPSPRDIYAAMSKTVVGQEKAKRVVSIAVHEHYSDIDSSDNSGVPNSHHVLFIGPSGSGKSLIVSTVSNKLELPYVSADSTVFSPTGFQGADVDSIVFDMAQKARGVVPLAERGVVFFDELDKLATYHHEGKAEVMNKSTQSSLLRMVEGKQVKIAQGPGEVSVVSTSKMLFFFAGAFNGLEDIVAKKMGFTGRSIGLRHKNDVKSMEDSIRTHEILSQATYDVLVESLEEYGIITELLGRIPSIVALAPLNTAELRKVAIETSHSPLILQQQLFRKNGYHLLFTEAFVDALVQRAHKMSTGTRALKSLMRIALSDAAFDLLGDTTGMVDGEVPFHGTVIIDEDALITAKYQLKTDYVDTYTQGIAITI